MTEVHQRYVDTGVKVLGALLTLVGIFVGIHQFNAGQAARVRTEGALLLKKDEVEFKRKLWLEKLDAYKEVAEIAGMVAANLENPDQRQAEFKRFIAAYWGTMILVEEKQVEEAMKNFLLEVQDLEGGWSTGDRVKARADALIRACRASIEHGEPKP